MELRVSNGEYRVVYASEKNSGLFARDGWLAALYATNRLLLIAVDEACAGASNRKWPLRFGRQRLRLRSPLQAASASGLPSSADAVAPPPPRPAWVAHLCAPPVVASPEWQAHCVLEYGERKNFRCDYGRVGEIREQLRRRDDFAHIGDVPMVLLSAVMTPPSAPRLDCTRLT